MRRTKLAALLMFTILALAIPKVAEAKIGWVDNADGHTYSDSDGCMHHVHTREWRFLGITWKTETVDIKVDCDKDGPDPVNE